MEDNQEQLAPQPVPSESPQAPPPRPKPALLNWLLIVFLFSLAVLGGVLYVQNTNKSQISTVVPTQIPQITSSPTPDVTANWKTYTNTKYGFSLQYPSQLFLKEAKPRTGEIADADTLYVNELHRVKIANTNVQGRIPGEFVVSVNLNPQKYTTDQLEKAYKHTGASGTDFAKFIKDTRLGTQSAKEFSVFDYDRGLTRILSVYNNKIYSVTFDKENPNDPDYESNKRINNKILQTFKFLPVLDNDQLLTIHYTGGLCPYGRPCSSTEVITRDGMYTKDGKELGIITNSDILELERLIAATDFAKIKAVKFTGTCPADYDAQAATYTFFTEKETEVLDECVVSIDMESPLFRKITQISRKYFKRQ